MDTTKEEAYHAGFDAGGNGSNTDNCHFSYFATPELCKEWERGNHEALFGCEKPTIKRQASMIKIAPNGDESYHE